MSARESQSEVLDAALQDVEESGAAFSVDLDGYEGPLHVLLSLARDQKVDLRRLSILKLAEQYLAFMAKARSARIDLAADYLVMAAWLAYLKSRLLLPKKERPSEHDVVEDLATHLAWRLARLDAMRTAGQSLYERPQTGLDVFVRGAPEAMAVTQTTNWQGDVWELLQAYAQGRARTLEVRHEVRAWPVYALDDARKHLESATQDLTQWCALGTFAPKDNVFKATQTPTPASTYASLTAASLELAKQGKLILRQLDEQSPLYICGVTHE